MDDITETPTETNDRRRRQQDRSIARLASRELGGYSLMAEPDAWAVFQRIRALKRSGASDAEILRRLNP